MRRFWHVYEIPFDTTARPWSCHGIFADKRPALRWAVSRVLWWQRRKYFAGNMFTHAPLRIAEHFARDCDLSSPQPYGDMYLQHNTIAWPATVQVRMRSFSPSEELLSDVHGMAEYVDGFEGAPPEGTEFSYVLKLPKPEPIDLSAFFTSPQACYTYWKSILQYVCAVNSVPTPHFGGDMADPLSQPESMKHIYALDGWPYTTSLPEFLSTYADD